MSDIDITLYLNEYRVQALADMHALMRLYYALKHSAVAFLFPRIP